MRAIGKTILIAALASALSLNAQQSVLDQAKAAADARDYAGAAQLYRQAVAAQPENVDALAGLADSLEASGGWRDAVPVLEHLIALQPNDAARLAQLGRMKSWQKGQRPVAIDLLKRACDAGKQHPEYCIQYADVLSWNAQDRPQAISVLREVVAANPADVSAIAKLAEVLSWSANTRAESVQLFDKAVKQDPKNAELLATYGEVLRYQGGSRATAMQCFEDALKIDPANARALNGKAQLLAWGGRTNEAMSLYDKVLAADRENVFALRGKAEIFNWREQYAQSAQLLDKARELAPDDPRVMVEIARTEVGRNNFGQARQALALLPYESEYRDIRGEVARALGTYVDLGYTTRLNNSFTYHRMSSAISTPLGLSNRLTFSYDPTFYQPKSGDYTGHSFGVQLDSRLSENAGLTTHFGADTYSGLPTGYNVGGQFRVKLRPSFEIQAGFERAPVDDSVMSMRGAHIGVLEQGQVRSNLGSLGFSYGNSHYHYDIWATYTDGLYTGLNLRDNRRWGFDGQIGKSVRGGAPYIRLAYGFSYSQFDYDANVDGNIPSFGGYFSPQQFLLNYGAVTINHKFGSKLDIQTIGTLGVQNVADTYSRFGNAQLASSFRSRVMWRVTDKDEIRFGYDYLNVYNAVNRSLPSISWRHYF